MSQIRGETDHCRSRLLKYCQGQGVDLGCGNTKIKIDSIGIDLASESADMHIDARLMPQFPDNHFDYVYSSHLLEEIQDTEPTLKEWLRILKPGGYLVLYQAESSLYFPLGSPQCNPRHKHHFNWASLWGVFEKIGGTELVHQACHTENKEWSFEFVVKKSDGNIIEVEEKMNSGISILVPTTCRPASIERFATEVNRQTKNPSNVEILFGIHSDDATSIQKIEEIAPKLAIKVRHEFIEKHPDGRPHLSLFWNQLYPKASHQIVGYFGDDVVFKTPGWDEEVSKEFSKDRGVLVCCNDVHEQRGRIATLFFTHKAVHDAVGYYLNEKFRRWFMDEFWSTAYQRAGKLHYREDIVTEHIHPNHFPQSRDEVYIRMENFKEEDRKIWNSSEMRDEINRCTQIIKNIK